MYKITFEVHVYDTYETENNIIFRLGSHFQHISLCICKYSKILYNPKSETLLIPSILDKGHSTYVSFIIGETLKTEKHK
jgi:hypothetical protein